MSGPTGTTTNNPPTHYQIGTVISNASRERPKTAQRNRSEDKLQETALKALRTTGLDAGIKSRESSKSSLIDVSPLSEIKSDRSRSVTPRGSDSEEEYAITGEENCGEHHSSTYLPSEHNLTMRKKNTHIKLTKDKIHSLWIPLTSAGREALTNVVNNALHLKKGSKERFSNDNPSITRLANYAINDISLVQVIYNQSETEIERAAHIIQDIGSRKTRK